MKKSFFIFSFLLLSTSCFAQLKELGKAGMETVARKSTAVTQLVKAAVTGQPLTSRFARGANKALPSEEEVKQALLKARFKRVESQLPYSLVRVVDVHDDWTETWASGFVFTDYSTGAPKTWAALVHHVSPKKNEEVILTIRRKDTGFDLISSVVAVTGRGGRNGVDISLAEIPDDVAAQLEPLHWAAQPPRAGQRVNSYGFNSATSWTRNFTKVGDREILDVSGFKIITTYNFGMESPSRFCGAPLLNEAGEVVGMHTGSLLDRSASFALTRQAVDDALQAYYTGHAYRPHQN